MFERPFLLWLLVAAPLAMMPGLFALRAGRMAHGRALLGLCDSTWIASPRLVMMLWRVCGFRFERQRNGWR